MGSKEKWAIAVVVIACAFYVFEWNALYLCAVGALIYLICRPGRR